MADEEAAETPPPALDRQRFVPLLQNVTAVPSEKLRVARLYDPEKAGFFYHPDTGNRPGPPTHRHRERDHDDESAMLFLSAFHIEDRR